MSRNIYVYVCYNMYMSRNIYVCMYVTVPWLYTECNTDVINGFEVALRLDNHRDINDW